MNEPLQRMDNILGDGELSYIELQDVMPHSSEPFMADRAVVNAARVSFLGDSKGDEQDKRLLFYLLRNRHTSPFEQVEFKFRVNAPVVVWWQWVRHRTMSYNFQSGRYVEFDEDSFYIPHQWRLQSKSNKQGSDGVVNEDINKLFMDLLTDQTQQGFDVYRRALEAGIAKEQARLFLPAWCSYYTAIVKVDAWNLMHFLRLRMATEAQWEIRQYANAMYTMFETVMPWSAEAFKLYIMNEE